MNWRDEYRGKCIDAKRAAELVQSGDRVVLGTLCAEPQTLVEALVADRARLRGVELLIGLTYSACPYARPDAGEHFRIVAMLSSPGTRDALREGRADLIPVRLSEIPRLFDKKYLPVDVAMVMVSPPANNGYFSLGVSVDYLRSAIKSAKIVVAEVNDRMPCTNGDSLVRPSDVDWIVETSRPIVTVPPEKPDEVQKAIGGNVATVIDDGSTIEIGVGAVPNAVLAALTTRRDLGVHSGLITDGIMDLVEAGVVNGRHKAINRGKVVGAAALGTGRLYDFVHDNPTIEMHPVSYTHGAAVLDRLDNFVAINSALQIDLTGQVNAEVIGGVTIGAVGGQDDFASAAARIPDGKSIIAMPSTAANCTVSRLVTSFERGVPVTTPRYNVQFVATEFGIVDLRGKTLRQRAEALISIAHPKFRESLAAECSVLSWRV